MGDRDSEAEEDRRTILDAVAFRLRLEEEVARVARSGGFLSLAVLHIAPGSTPRPRQSSGALRDMAERLRRAVRLEDVLGQRMDHVALLMPDTSSTQSQQAAQRLLSILNANAARPGGGLAAAGLATIYGEIEGGGAALLAAAEEALHEAAAGRFAASRTLEGRPRVLVVDDDATFAEMLAEAISERGWEAHPCTDIADARQRVKEETYGGLFIDVNLPRGSGLEILSDAVSGQARRPAVVMSGLDVDPERVVDALALGPVLFMRKPLSLSDIDSALDMFRKLGPGVRRRPGKPPSGLR